jgi:hypothetical protein
MGNLMSKKIFITGCAKSGTTLLLRMCYAFENAEVLYKPTPDGHELPFDEFINYSSDSRFIIGKRHPPAILSNKVSDEVSRQYGVIKTQDIGIINVVRDGRDVVLSDGSYVKPDRWISTIKQRELYKDIIDIEIKYEELIQCPDEIQTQLEDKYGLVSKHRFSEYPEYVEDWVYNWNVSILGRQGKGNSTDYGKRKLSSKSIGKNMEKYKELCNSRQERDEFELALETLNYEV